MTATAFASSDARALSMGRHQRVDGAVTLRAGRTGIEHLYQRAPCRILFPQAEHGEPLHAVTITTSGGVTSGDRLRTSISVGDGASLTISTQAAEKIYRAVDGEPETLIATHLSAGNDAWLEWLGQEAILFDRARVRRLLEIDLAASSRLLAVESLVFGRAAMGEVMATGHVFDRWKIRRAGRLIWVDALRLDGDIAKEMAQAFAFDGATAIATIVYAGGDAASHIDAARALAGEHGGATTFDGLLIVRLLGDPAAVRAAIVRVAGGLRARAGTLSSTLPAIWSC